MSSLPSKLTTERNQKALLELVTKPGNDVCADCKARNPRWASHNLGIFICMNCASIHRKIGTHITRVKSITMDTWTNDQVDVMRNMGNTKSNAIYNPNEARHPPPPNLEDGERDSEMEQYIRAKYEYRKFISKSALAASKLGPSRSATSITPRSASSPITSETRSSTLPSNTSSNLRNPPIQEKPSVPSAPLSSNLNSQRSVSQPVIAPTSQPQQQQQPPAGSVWNDLVQLQGDNASSNSTLPLQMAQPTFGSTLPTSFSQPALSATPTGYNPYQTQLQPQFTSASLGSSQFTPQFQGAMQPTSSFGQQLFMSHTGMSAGGSFGNPAQQSAQFFQPQPQSAAPSVQNPSAHQGFLTPSPSQGLMSAPVGQTQFMTPSPQQFLSASPQYQSQMGLQPQPTGMFTGMTTPSPQPMGMGMMPNGTSPSPGLGVMGGGQFNGGMMQQQHPMQMSMQQQQQPMQMGMQQQQQGQFLQGLPSSMFSPANFQAATGNNPFAQRHGTM